MTPCQDCLQQKEIGRIWELEYEAPANHIVETCSRTSCNSPGNDGTAVNRAIFLYIVLLSGKPHYDPTYKLSEPCGPLPPQNRA